MKQISMIEPLQYLVKEDGQRVGVVLSWADYQNIRAKLPPDPDLLSNLGEAELQTLTEGMLATRHQERLDELLRRNREERLTADEERELDLLLERVDSMNKLKARALYTLQYRREETREYLADESNYLR